MENPTTETLTSPEVAASVNSNELVIEDDLTETEPPVQPATEEPVVINKQQRVLIETQITSPAQESSISLNMPSANEAELQQFIENTPNISLTDSKKAEEWGETIIDGAKFIPRNQAYISTLQDEKAEFTNNFTHNGASLMGGAPRLKETSNSTLEGEKGVIRLITHLGLGSLFNTPLWHSGIRITFKPSTESELIELNRLMIADKIDLGRYTYGLVFSNSTAFTTHRLIDFIFNHIYDISIKPGKDFTTDSLLDLIPCQDIPSIIWGFACSLYPKGFNHRRGCISDPEKCNLVFETNLHLPELQFPNRLALTEWQKNHMADRQMKVKEVESIKRYKEELAQTQNKRVLLAEVNGKKVYMTLKTPSIREYINAGYKWLEDINSMVDKTLGTTTDIEEKNELIKKHGLSTTMRQYSHWVQSIEVGSNLVEDQSTIELTLNQFSPNDVFRNNFMEAVTDYINTSSVAVIGIPVFKCPNCGAEQETDNSLPNYKNIIPLDPLQLFFALLTQRLNTLANR